MLFDLRHHAICKQLLTEQFELSVKENLLPRLSARFGASLAGIQMYEDYLSDRFYADGKVFYPLTVITNEAVKTVWISWTFDENDNNFAGGIPFAYVGDDLLDFDLPSDVPTDFVKALAGRSVYYDGTYLPIGVETSEASILTMAGRYSETFVDEMGKQVTALLEKNAGVSSVVNSGIGLKLIFAPGTYMEHTSGNRTYRRLMMTDSVRTVRDLWVMWERKDGGAYSVADTPAPDSVVFSIDMPVPLSIREREYRFLVRTCPEEYEKAMATRNLTAFHTVIRRAVARGDLFDLPKEPVTSTAPVQTAPAPQIPLYEEPIEKPISVPTVEEPVIPPVKEESAASKTEQLSLFDELIAEQPSEPKNAAKEETDPLLLALAKAAGVPLPEAEEPKEEAADPWLDALRASGFASDLSVKDEEESQRAAEAFLTERMRREYGEETAPVTEPEPVVIPEPEPVVIPEPEPVVIPEPEPVVIPEPKPLPKPEPKKEKHPLTKNYVLHLYFRFSTDPNASEYIRDILLNTLKSEGKEDLDISVKAVAVSYNELTLSFFSFPESEKSVLMKMISAIGKSNIGVGKIILDDN